MAMHSTAFAAPESFFPASVVATFAPLGIHAAHLDMLLGNNQVMHSLRHFDQVRRDVSANPAGSMDMLLHRITLAQQSLISHINAAWQPYPAAQTQLKAVETQHAVIDALLCCQP